MNIDITDAAINQLLIKKRDQGVEYIRLGVTGGGCAGYEYIFDTCDTVHDDIVLDFGRIKFVVDKLSVPYIEGMTLDWQKEGLNEMFKFINPKEVSSCGCGVSVNFSVV